MSEKQRHLDLVVNDLEEFIDQEQEDKDVDRETAACNVLFEWRAYYRDDAPKYVDKFEHNLARQIIDDEVMHFKENPSSYKGGLDKDAAYTITVNQSQLESVAKKTLKQELKERGEPVK